MSDAVSGPTALLPISMPSTVNESIENDGKPLLPAELEPPSGGPLPGEGNVPENLVSVRISPPLAAATPSVLATLATSAAGSVVDPACGCTVSREILRVPL